MASSAAPIEVKVAAAGSTSIVTGVVTWLLVTYVGTFRHGLPPSLATFLPFVVSAVLGTLSGWLAPHTPRPDVPAGAHQAP